MCKGDSIVIPGAGGGLGHLAMQIGRGMGFRMIVRNSLTSPLFHRYELTSTQGIDSGEKEEFVKSLGAEAFFDLNKYSRDADGNKQLQSDVIAASSGKCIYTHTNT